MRYSFIDSLRGFAILCMVLIHIPRFLLVDRSGEFYALLEIMGTFAAPLFLFIVGFSLVLSKKPPTYQVKRGLIIFGFGLLFMTIWEPDILHFIGLFIIIASFMKRLGPGLLLTSAAIIAAISPLARQFAGYTHYWSVLGFAQARPFADLILLMLTSGFHPLFPWLSFVFLGMFSAKIFTTVPMPFFRKWFTIIGALITIMAIPLSRTLPITFYPASGLFVLFQAGLLILLSGITASESEKHSVLSSAGRYSLSLYVLHVAIIIPFRMESLSSPTVYVITAIWIVLLFTATTIMRKRGITGPLEKSVRSLSDFYLS